MAEIGSKRNVALECRIKSVETEWHLVLRSLHSSWGGCFLQFINWMMTIFSWNIQISRWYNGMKCSHEPNQLCHKLRRNSTEGCEKRKSFLTKIAINKQISMFSPFFNYNKPISQPSATYGFVDKMSMSTKCHTWTAYATEQKGCK